MSPIPLVFNEDLPAIEESPPAYWDVVEEAPPVVMEPPDEAILQGHLESVPLPATPSTFCTIWTVSVQLVVIIMAFLMYLWSR